MDQQNYYHGKHGTLNYSAAFGNSSSDYHNPGFNDPSPLHHTTGISFNSSTNGTNNVCNDLSNSTAANLSRSANNNASGNSTSVNDYNAVPYNRLYSYIPENAVQNMTSVSSNASDSNNITYGSTFNSKSYENTTNSTHVPVIAATTNSSHTRTYHSNINYGSYQNVDYGMHKTLNQNYTTGAIMSSPSTQNRSTLNSTTAFTSNIPMDHVVQQSVKSRINSNGDSSKISAKTSVIKPLNAYNTATPGSAGSAPINYTKYVPSYPVYASNNKTVSNMDKSPPATNRSMYLSSSATHKNSEVYCPAPIPARYSNPGYPINVSTTGTVHTNSHYLTANSYPLNYGHHHLAQHQASVPHSRNLLSTPGYQSSLDESVSANYYNRPNGLVVRPTPNMLKQSQIPYQNAYGYERNNITNTSNLNHASGSHSTFQKPQTHKPVDEAYNPMAIEYDSAYDRRNFRQYSYSSNFMDSTSFDDYSQYSGFAPTNSGTVPFYPSKTPSKILQYNYNSGLNVYNSGSSHVPLTPQTSPSVAVSSSASMPTTSTTTIVQQPMPINPSSSQLISSNYDATSLHSHPILPPPPLFNNNNKEYCSTNQYHQQSQYASQILYSTLQNGGYYPVKPNQSTVLPSNASNAHGGPEKMCSSEKTLISPAHGKYSTIDLEEQINSSKIPKTAGTVILNSKLNQRNSDFETKMSMISAQDSLQRQQRRISSSSQDVIESNKNAFVYSNNAYNRSCYETHQQWQKPVCSAPASTAITATTTSTTPYLHPKKICIKNLRDFLSSWNEDGEEDIDQMSKKTSHSLNHSHSLSHSYNQASQPHIVSGRGVRFDKLKRLNENVPVIVQPTAQVQPNNLHSAIAPQDYRELPPPAVPLMSPNMHVGHTVDNGNQNLPDIINDIEKTKVGGESECFERANGKYII